ncbi:hypothetical protein E4T43_04679 [Aureobasidium subglaciale]|nr:hypothetical protein E4T43_04679 [Aureobasidium subglaciale]
MAGSVQGSAIDDSFETLTNAPDAWVSGRYTAPPPVDYQHYVEPGDARSAVDDRCFTEYGAVEHAPYVNHVPRPVKADQKRHRSRQISSPKPAPPGRKRRPSPNLRIRSKDGESVVVSNPFVLRRPSRPQPDAASSVQSEDGSEQSSSTTAARSRTFNIRIRGKNGEEAIQEIKRPLHFASQEITVVGDESNSANVKYWSADSSPSSHQTRGRETNWKSGLTTSTDFVKDSTTVPPSTAGSSIKMTGALPEASPAPTTDSSRSRRLPPGKPASSIHDSVMSDSGYRSKAPSPSASHYSKASAKDSSNVDSPKDFITVADDSLEGSITASISALSTHCIVSPRPLSPVSHWDDSASVFGHVSSQNLSTKSFSELSSSKHISVPPFSVSSAQSSVYPGNPSKSSRKISQHSKQTQETLARYDSEEEDHESRPATITTSNHTEPRHDSYYNWKVSKDSLYSNSTRDSRQHSKVKTVSSSSSSSSHTGGVPLTHTNVETIPPLSIPSEETRQTLSGWDQPPFPSLVGLNTQEEGANVDDQVWDKSPVSDAAADSGWIDDMQSEHASFHSPEQEASGWEEPAEWNERQTSSHRSKSSQHTRSHRSRTSRSRSSRHQSDRATEHEYGEQGSRAGDERHSKRSSARSASSVNIEEDLLPYLPNPSDDERLPPPAPTLTTIYEESENTLLSRHTSSILTEEPTRFARPGAISPHPLSSVSSAATARKPPTIEPHRLGYQRPYIESNSSSSASGGARRSSRSRSSRTRLLEEAYLSASEGRAIKEGVTESSRASAKPRIRGWKLW